MRIGINLIPFSTVQGIEIFSKNIISESLKLKKDEEFFILGSENMPELLMFPKVKLIKIKGLKGKYGKALYQQTLIYSLLKKYKIDLLFSPSPAAPFFYKNKVVVIHDCAYVRFKEFENLLSKIYFRAMFYGAKYFSKKIITVSNFSKKELIELYRIDSEKIEVIYEGVPELPEVNEEFIQKTLTKFKIDKPYFLYIGNWRPRKNLPGLIKAFKLLRERGFDYLLVIGGRKDKRFLDLEKEIKNNRLEGKVILTDTLSREEVSALYRKAIALTFPSFYEGFGLPVLEAQSLGVPVLTSNTSSLPEIAGEGALYVDPYNVEEIAKGMERIAFNENLRRELIKK
jgi:glycosyltransferase involved in cell wall biosynthesis